MERYLPYGRQSIDDDDIESVVRVLRSDFLTTGPEISAFERELCDYTGARNAVAMSSATAALHLAVCALELPVDSIGVTTPNTFVATSNALLYSDLEPRFVDIDPRTYLLDPVKLNSAIESFQNDANVSVILPVHFAGNTEGIERVSEIARSRHIPVIEDAAHAIGGRYVDGSRVGSCQYSDMTVFSFHPVKTMTTGEGGAITTNDDVLYNRLIDLRTHGITRDPARLSVNPGPWYYEMQMLGYNYRMTDIQAALGRSQLRKLDGFVRRRSEIVARYNDAFSDLSWLTTPSGDSNRETGWHLYVLQFDWDRIGLDRVTVMSRLRDSGVGSQVLYIPVPLQPYYRERFGYSDGDFPEAERYYQHSLAIPLYPAMTDDDQRRVIDAVRGLGP